jgi:hypothetical protein
MKEFGTIFGKKFTGTINNLEQLVKEAILILSK